MASTPSKSNIRQIKSDVGQLSKLVSSPVPELQNNCQKQKKCVCSPTNHPGSFRCSLHRGTYILKNNGAEKAVAENDSMRKVPTVVLKHSASEKKCCGDFQLHASSIVSCATDDL